MGEIVQCTFNQVYHKPPTLTFFFFLLQKRREDRLAPRPRHLELGRRANVAKRRLQAN